MEHESVITVAQLDALKQTLRTSLAGERIATMRMYHILHEMNYSAEVVAGTPWSSGERLRISWSAVARRLPRSNATYSTLIDRMRGYAEVATLQNCRELCDAGSRNWTLARLLKGANWMGRAPQFDVALDRSAGHIAWVPQRAMNSYVDGKDQHLLEAIGFPLSQKPKRSCAPRGCKDGPAPQLCNSVSQGGHDVSFWRRGDWIVHLAGQEHSRHPSMQCRELMLHYFNALANGSVT